MKHARPDYNDRIVDTAGLIPDDEPVMLFRGQDRLADDSARPDALGHGLVVSEAVRQRAHALAHREEAILPGLVRRNQRDELFGGQFLGFLVEAEALIHAPVAEQVRQPVARSIQLDLGLDTAALTERAWAPGVTPDD